MQSSIYYWACQVVKCYEPRLIKKIQRTQYKRRAVGRSESPGASSNVVGTICPPSQA